MFEHVGEEGELEDLPPPLPVVLQLPEAVAAPGDGNAFPALRIGKTEFGTMLLDEVGAGRLLRRQSAALPARFQGPHSLTGKTDGQEHLPDQLPGGGARTLSRQAAVLQRQFEAWRSLCKVGEGGAVFFQGNLRCDGLPLGTELRVAEGESAHGAAVDFDPVLCEMRRSGGRGEQGGRHEQRNRKSRPVHRISPSAGDGMFLVLSIPYYMNEYKWRIQKNTFFFEETPFICERQAIFKGENTLFSGRIQSKKEIPKIFLPFCGRGLDID